MRFSSRAVPLRNRRRSALSRPRADDWCDDYGIFWGFGSTHDMAADDSDPRNPKLSGLRSVSYAAAVAMRRDEPADEPAPMGFRIPTSG